MLLTRNVRDFPVDRLSEAGVETKAADDFLVELLDSWRKPVLDAVKLTASRKRISPQTSCELVNDFPQAGTRR